LILLYSLIKSSTTSSIIPYKKPTTPSLKIERRKTTYNKELDLSDQLASVVGGHQVDIYFYFIYFINYYI
jgi:hypothetical protein